MIISGDVQCPQCGYMVCVDCYPDFTSDNNTDICDDCGCTFKFNYEVVMEIKDVSILTKGTNWENEDD